MSEHVDDQITDGRRRKGRRRRRLLLEATMRVIEREGVSAVSQRSVARAADLPPSAVTYYFPTVDDLLVATLTACNDDYLRRLDECASATNPLARLASLIADNTATGRGNVAAEYELLLLAARRADLQSEAARWADAVDAFLAAHIDDPVRRAGAAAAVDGLFLRCLCYPHPPTREEVLATLEPLVDTD